MKAMTATPKKDRMAQGFNSYPSLTLKKRRFACFVDKSVPHSSWCGDGAERPGGLPPEDNRSPTRSIPVLPPKDAIDPDDVCGDCASAHRYLLDSYIDICRCPPHAHSSIYVIAATIERAHALSSLSAFTALASVVLSLRARGVVDCEHVT